MLQVPEFKQSRETRIIYRLFQERIPEPPHLATIMEIEEAAGKPINKLRGPIATALKRLLKDDRIVAESDRGIGYRLRKDNELADSGHKSIVRARRIQETGLKKMNCVNDRLLSSEEKAIHNIKKSVLKLSLVPSEPRKVSILKQMVMRKHNELDEEEMLKAIVDALSKKS